MATIHEPALLKEVLDGLNVSSNRNYVDGTFGGGGHSLAILEKIKPNGKLIGIDLDPQAVQDSQNDNLILVNDNYKNLKQIIHDAGIDKISGILLDLGLSSDQLGSGDRGFSFQGEGFLDLRYDTASDRPTAKEILGQDSEQELVKIFKEYGEEPLARPIAKKIIANRLNGQFIETADMLVQLISTEYRKHFRARSRKNPAARVFQALRIAVNDEYGNIKQVLPDAVEVLEPGGRLAVITFHSGEDRIVKHYFKTMAGKDYPKIKLINKKPIIASEAELKRNPRSRSAKLRVIERI